MALFCLRRQRNREIQGEWENVCSIDQGKTQRLGGRRKPWEEQDILGTPFAVVPLGKRTNWAKLQKIVGRYASRVVVPPGLKLPNSKIWRAFAGERFEEKLLENTVKSLAGGLGLAAE